MLDNIVDAMNRNSGWLTFTGFQLVWDDWDYTKASELARD